MIKLIAAHKLKMRLGRILRQLRQNDRFVILRRNLPVGILLSIQDYVKEHPDQYEDVKDFIDTLVEESDTRFQRSLQKAAGQIKRGHYVRHTALRKLRQCNV